MHQVRRQLGFPVSERIMRRVVHNVAKDTAEAAAAEQSAASTGSPFMGLGAAGGVSSAAKKRRARKKRQNAAKASARLKAKAELQKLKPYIPSNLPDMNSIRNMPKPLHAYHQLAQLEPIQLMSLKWGAGRELLPMRSVHDELEEKKRNVPSVIAMDMARYKKRQEG